MTDVPVRCALEFTHRTTETTIQGSTVELNLAHFLRTEDDVEEVIHAVWGVEHSVAYPPVGGRHILQHRHAGLNRWVSLGGITVLRRCWRNHLRIGLTIVSNKHRLVRTPFRRYLNRRLEPRSAAVNLHDCLVVGAVLTECFDLRTVFQSDESNHVTAVVLDAGILSGLTGNTQWAVHRWNRYEVGASHFKGQHGIMDVVANEVSFGCEHARRRKNVGIAHDGHLGVTRDHAHWTTGANPRTGQVRDILFVVGFVDLRLDQEGLSLVQGHRSGLSLADRRLVATTFGVDRWCVRYNGVVARGNHQNLAWAVLVVPVHAIAILVEVHAVVIPTP